MLTFRRAISGAARHEPRRALLRALPTNKQITALLSARGRSRPLSPETALGTWAKFGERFDDISLAAALSCVARSAARSPDALRAGLAREPLRTECASLLARVAERLQHLQPRELVTVMHDASALPDESAHKLVRSAAALAREAAPRLTPQGMCLALRACAKLGIVDHALLDAISAEAFGRAGSPAAESAAADGPRAAGMLERFSPQDLSQLTWAYATLRRGDDALFARVAAVAPAKLAGDGASTQALANIAWAYARSGAAGVAGAAELLDEVSAHALRRVDEFKPFELAMILWALAKAQRPNVLLFQAAAHCLARDVARLPAQSLSNAAWAFAKVDVRAEPLFRAIAASAPARLDTFSAQALVNLAWAFCVASLLPAQLLRQLVSRIELVPVGPETPVAYWQQIQQLDNALRLDAPSLGIRLSPALVGACRVEICKQHGARKPSNLHRAVSDALRHLRVEHVDEFCVPELCYHVDIALPQHRLVIEVNGTMWHRHAADTDARGAPFGRHLMKYRHLRASGWRVLLVSSGEWAELGGCVHAQGRFLAEKIDAATARRSDALGRERRTPPIVWDEEGGKAAGADAAAARAGGAALQPIENRAPPGTVFATLRAESGQTLSVLGLATSVARRAPLSASASASAPSPA
ncbi:hypothetical protein KFE25_013394 [Diacronema lutheri]|uniref:RAP domain-containing protein n=2 Tax=Diacronema lutheri TaxID=2081491 RepID=A0A8J5XGA7_DIALT|nr:hypothetical protein KFE25_013394 [Diacronema lutheri]